MVLKLAKKFQIDEGAGVYEDLSEGVKNLYLHFSYSEIVRPLICMDKKENPSISLDSLATRYGVAKTSVYRILITWQGFVDE
jgi:hypothetical protein